MNKHIISLILVGCLSGMTFQSCSRVQRKIQAPRVPSDKIVSETHHLDDFNGIIAANGIIVDYVPQAAEENVNVTGPENVVAALKIDNQGGNLYFEVSGPKDFIYESEAQRLHVVVAQPDVSHFQAMAEASIRVADTLRLNVPVTVEAYSDASVSLSALSAPVVTLSSYTNSDIQASVYTENCSVSAYAQSDITLYGSAASLELTASSAQVEASRLHIETGTATAMDKALVRVPSQVVHRRELTGGKIENASSRS